MSDQGEVAATSAGRMPNFDALRILFAACVIVSHSFALVGRAEPVIWLSTLGVFAVHGFFAMSGYLVTRSALRLDSVPRYLAARGLRIVPGLVVATVFATLAAQFADHYATNPGPAYVNAPVWTLVWESLCYLGVAVFLAIGLLRRSSFAPFLAAAWLLMMADVQSVSGFYLAVVPMLIVFAGGAMVALIGTLRRSTVTVAAVGLALTVSFPLFNWLFTKTLGWVPITFVPEGVTTGAVFRWVYLACLPIVVIWIGTWQKRVIRVRWDISYGLYIYGWPVGQLLVFAAVSRSTMWEPRALALATLAFTVPIALASWLVIERPALRLKKYFEPKANASAEIAQIPGAP